MIIVIQCKDQVGLVAAIAGILVEDRFNIVSMREHVDKAENRFFMRLELEQDPSDASSQMIIPSLMQEKIKILQEKMGILLPAGSVITVNPLPEKKMVVLVSREYHCLADILVRHYFKTLGVSVQCVIGNHGVLKDICRRVDMPFYLVEEECRILEILEEYLPDYIVLAKFMRILSPAVVSAFPMRIINIHHSFLPAFAGANAYRQAFARGVKLIGATAHFVTDELDEGPIIAQEIIPVNHSYTAADMIRAGKEIETSVLARALRLVFEDRVFVYRNKTVVFE
jgi:formyltetrahydrofolate deformylase